MKQIRRLLRLTLRRTIWEMLAELFGFVLLVAAAWMVHEIAGVATAGLVALNYAYGRRAGGGE